MSEPTRSEPTVSESTTETIFDGIIEVRVSVPDAVVADAIATTLVEERLAACVQALPGMRSTYWWQDAVDTSDEVLLLAKSTRARFDRICERVGDMHPYETPEILAVDVPHVSASYAAWIAEALGIPTALD